jgi:hypothetical protein
MNRALLKHVRDTRAGNKRSKKRNLGRKKDRRAKRREDPQQGRRRPRNPQSASNMPNPHGRFAPQQRHTEYAERLTDSAHATLIDYEEKGLQLELRGRFDSVTGTCMDDTSVPYSHSEDGFRTSEPHCQVMASQRELDTRRDQEARKVTQSLSAGMALEKMIVEFKRRLDTAMQSNAFEYYLSRDPLSKAIFADSLDVFKRVSHIVSLEIARCSAVFGQDDADWKAGIVKRITAGCDSFLKTTMLYSKGILKFQMHVIERQIVTITAGDKLHVPSGQESKYARLIQDSNTWGAWFARVLAKIKFAVMQLLQSLKPLLIIGSAILIPAACIGSLGSLVPALPVFLAPLGNVGVMAALHQAGQLFCKLNALKITGIAAILGGGLHTLKSLFPKVHEGVTGMIDASGFRDDANRDRFLQHNGLEEESSAIEKESANTTAWLLALIGGFCVTNMSFFTETLFGAVCGEGVSLPTSGFMISHILTQVSKGKWPDSAVYQGGTIAEQRGALIQESAGQLKADLASIGSSTKSLNAMANASDASQVAANHAQGDAGPSRIAAVGAMLGFDDSGVKTANANVAALKIQEGVYRDAAADYRTQADEFQEKETAKVVGTYKSDLEALPVSAPISLGTQAPLMIAIVSAAALMFVFGRYAFSSADANPLTKRLSLDVTPRPPAKFFANSNVLTPAIADFLVFQACRRDKNNAKLCLDENVSVDAQRAEITRSIQEFREAHPWQNP